MREYDRLSIAAASLVSAEQWAAITAAYATPPRAYHNLGHVLEVLQHYEAVLNGPGWMQPHEVCLAVLYHDAVYVPASSENERESAALAKAHIAAFCTLNKAAVLDAERVASLILMTSRHGQWLPGELDKDAELFLDCDMAILGASPRRFDLYGKQIAQEYSDCVPDAVFRARRRSFMEGLLARERVFLSDFFHTRYDAAARANLQRALQA